MDPHASRLNILYGTHMGPFYSKWPVHMGPTWQLIAYSIWYPYGAHQAALTGPIWDPDTLPAGYI